MSAPASSAPTPEELTRAIDRCARIIITSPDAAACEHEARILDVLLRYRADLEERELRGPSTP